MVLNSENLYSLCFSTIIIVINKSILNSILPVAFSFFLAFIEQIAIALFIALIV